MIGAEASLAPAAVPHVTRPQDKIQTLDGLAEIANKIRAGGGSIVQAHGTFDLLHLGHVRHLEAARRLGDVLIVTITADRYVNKGPGRPVFGADLRAEMLAALSCVDWVAINDTPDALRPIARLRPHIYVKGQDYENPEGDITSKITLERAAVEAYGGRLHITDEITFSSSELINRHINVFEPHVREKLSALRLDGGLAEMLELIERVRNYRVLLVGDAIMDEYRYVLPMAKAPKENMIATRYMDRELFAGGVFAAANHVASFCAQVDVITCLGDAQSYEAEIRDALRPNVGLHRVVRPGAPTTCKTRFIDPSYMHKLFEVYLMNDEPLTGDLGRELDDLIGDMAPHYDVVIATDFGHGMLGRSSVEALTSRSRFLAVNTQTNSANMGYNLVTRYGRADYVCIDAPEARLALSDRMSAIGDIAHTLISTRIDCPKIIITHGKHGCVTLEQGGVAHIRSQPSPSASSTRWEPAMRSSPSPPRWSRPAARWSTSASSATWPAP
jgi:rfaE bifunctional protein nucleotidyltransferase chain/domain